MQRLGKASVTTDLVRRHCAAVPLHLGKLRVIKVYIYIYTYICVYIVYLSYTCIAMYVYVYVHR